MHINKKMAELISNSLGTSSSNSITDKNKRIFSDLVECQQIFEITKSEKTFEIQLYIY
jgi:hypothetical protein